MRFSTCFIVHERGRSSFKIHDASRRLQKLAWCLASFIFSKYLFPSALSFKNIYFQMDMLSKRAPAASTQQVYLSSGPIDAITSRAFTISCLKHSCEHWGSTFFFVWLCFSLFYLKNNNFMYWISFVWCSSHFLIIVMSTKMNRERVISLHYQKWRGEWFPSTLHSPPH